MPVEVAGHEHAGTALVRGALATQAADFTVLVHLVVLEDSQLNLLPLVLVLLGSGVRLLLPFLGTTTESQHQVQSGLLLNVVVR